MRSLLWFVLLFVILASALTFLSVKARQAKNVTPSEADGWNYKVGLPVIPPDHDVTLTFHIVETATSAEGTKTYLCDYAAGGHTARFKMELDRSNRSQTQGILMQFGKGRILADSTSDSRSLLQALAIALDGKVPLQISRQPVVPFEYVHFGDNMSAIPGGGYQFKPAGPWTAMKLFLGSTEADSATVYFSLNPAGGEARFSSSMSEYGDDVLAHLAPGL